MTTKPIALDLDDNHSSWVPERTPSAPQPTLQAPLRVDVAIIGGGFTGVSTAYHLSRRYPEKRVVLLEARRLANGASGRSGGQMLNWISGMGDDEETLRRVFHTTRQAIDTIIEINQRHALSVDIRREGILHVQTSTQSAEAAHAEVERLTGLGIPLQYLRRAELAARLELHRAQGAVLDPSEGQINGVEYLRGLHSVLLQQGVEVYEDTPVVRIREGRTITLTTPGAEVRAQAVVLATNAYTPRLGYFRSAIFPLICHVAATRPLSDAEMEAIGWHGTAGWGDDFQKLLYVTRTGEGRIVFGGGPAGYEYLYGNRTRYGGSLSPDAPVSLRMRQTLAGYLPGAADLPITHRWSGPVAVNLNGLSGLIGVRGDHRNVFYALGYSGHGVVLANLAGCILTDLYSGDDQPWRMLPIVQPSPAPIPPEPLRWLGAQLYMGLAGASRRRRLW
jgi:glycine/D-amino acid oxidase-like deaminating enzyme